MTTEEFQEWLQKNMKWNWDMNIDSQGKLNLSLTFGQSFPTLDGAKWRARAYFIVPNFSRKRNLRAIKSGLNRGGYLSKNTPEWYPLSKGGWTSWWGGSERQKFAEIASDSPKTALSWTPLGTLVFSDLIKNYTYSYCRHVIAASEDLETGDMSRSEELTERGKIRQDSLDVYLSVAISFIVSKGGNDVCVFRSFGVPRHFVSKELM